MSRVKPHTITSPAQEVFRKIRKAAIWVVVGLVLLVPMLFAYNWATSPGEWHFPWSGSGGSGPVVSVGPRCDNQLVTTEVVSSFRPIHAGCLVEWGINDNSPLACITLIGVHGPIQPQACRGYEQNFAGIPITGWQTAGGTALVDVIYRPN